MANFFRKLVERQKSRSKSPVKGRSQNGMMMMVPPNDNRVPAFHPWRHDEQVYEKYNGDYVTATRTTAYMGAVQMDEPIPIREPPPMFLPLPPSPALTSRNSSRQTLHVHHSNDSLGVKSWNTEKDDGGSSFFLNRQKDDTLREEPSLFGEHRSRSESPLKKMNQNGTLKTHRSKSPVKKRNIAHSFDYLNQQCHIEGCSAAIIVQNAKFLVCRHQLSHASDYFRSLLQNGTEVCVTVSGMQCPSPVTQFKWFLESTIPFPALKDIADDTLETCMRLSRRFEAKCLELRCNKYIIENAPHRQPMVVLCWLNWCLQHGFSSPPRSACLPSVARLSLASLEQHRHMMTEKIFADIVAAKLRGAYDKAVSVFETIHRLDHFSVELEKCPRCGRTKEQGTVRVHAFPCRKMLGCERCTKELGCELEQKAQGEMEAFHQCPHALLPMNETTDDCFCHMKNLSRHLNSSFAPVRPPPTGSNGFGTPVYGRTTPSTSTQ